MTYNFDKDTFVVIPTDNDLFVKIRDRSPKVVKTITDDYCNLTLNGNTIILKQAADTKPSTYSFDSITNARIAFLNLETALAKLKENKANKNNTNNTVGTVINNKSKTVLLSEIWTDSPKIPIPADQNNTNYLHYYDKLVLTHIPNTYKFSNINFIDVVPPYVDDSYIVKVYTYDDVLIPDNYKGLTIDWQNGIIEFKEGFSTIGNIQFDSTKLPKVTFYKYIGSKGQFNTSSNTIGEWQDSVITFLDIANNNNDLINKNYYYYIHTAFDSWNVGDIINYYNDSWVLYNVINKTRFILKFNIVLSVYDQILDISNSVTCNTNNIIEYWDNNTNNTNNGGWLKNIPSTGWFTSLDNILGINNIYRFNGSEWIVQEFEQTIPTSDNKNMIASLTTIDGDIGCSIPLSKTPSNNSYIQVFVNGKYVLLGNGYLSGNITFDCLFAKQTATIEDFSNSSVLFASNHNLVNGDNILLVQSDGIFIKTIASSNTNEITYDTPTTNGTLLAIYKHKDFSNIEKDDILLWFGSYANYELDTTDIIDYMYVTNIT